MKPPSIYEIVDAFPSEIEPQARRHIPRLQKKLKPYCSFFEQLEHQDYDRFTKDFISEVVRVLYMPKHDLYCLNRLKKMRKLAQNKDKPKKVGYIDTFHVERAKAVPLSEFIEVFRRGSKEWARCPWHEDKTPSFMVNKNNTGHCYSCSWHGDSIALVMKLNNMNFIDAVRYLNERS